MQFATLLTPSAAEDRSSRGEISVDVPSCVASRLFSINPGPGPVRLRLMAAIGLAPVRAGFAARFLWPVACLGSRE